MSAVDVLAVLDRLDAKAERARWAYSVRDDIAEVRAAMAELIEADKEYDAALARQPTQFLGRGYAKGMDRIERAKARRAAALTRVGGGKP